MRHAVILALAFSIAGCATRTSSSVDMRSAILVTPNDITDRPYENLGDIHVTVSKTTIFNKDPTEETVNDALREKAAELGANAVIFARHGDVTVGMLSYGEMDGAGRAVRFVR